MSLYAVSDLHIAGSNDPLYRSLLRLLRERVQAGDTMVFVGDVFDLFIGNKKIFRDRYREFFDALSEIGQRGASIHYIEGNHDFQLRGAFSGLRGLTLHTRDFEVEVGGRRFFFSHGDLVDSRDYGYRFLRAFFRSPVMKTFVAVSPGKLLDWIGQSSSRLSSESKPRLPASLPTARLEYLRNTYRSYAAERMAAGSDFVVMGHCHDLDEKSFVIGARSGQYVNVGFPRVHGSFLSWNPGDEKIHRERMPD